MTVARCSSAVLNGPYNGRCIRVARWVEDNTGELFCTQHVRIYRARAERLGWPFDVKPTQQGDR